VCLEASLVIVEAGTVFWKLWYERRKIIFGEGFVCFKYAVVRRLRKFWNFVDSDGSHDPET
jgi:hypothetical protein